MRELVCIDIETKDPHLKKKGAGVRRGDGHITGVGVGYLTSEGAITTRYFNLTHEGKENQRALIIHELEAIRRSGLPITGANLLYDFDWILETFGIDFSRTNPWRDVQVAEPLLDENAKTYSLNALAQKYLGESKEEDSLHAYCAAQFGGKADKSQAKNYWRVPFKIIEPYVQQDLRLPLLICEAQGEQLRGDDQLHELFILECRLQPILLGMKRRGVKVDVARCEEMVTEFSDSLDREMVVLKNLNNGVFVEIWAANSVAQLFDNNGVKYGKTKKGNPSFTKEFLEICPSPIAKAVLRARQFEKLKNTFLEKAILGHQINGRIHAQFNQLRGDDYGTVTGRFSSSLPNLQQIPQRTEIGKRVRTLFEPEDGQHWAKADYSQIEPRLLLSYAPRRMVQHIVDQYAANPSLSCYNALGDLMPGLDYNVIKAIYLGATYGMGKETMATNIGCSVEEAEPMFDSFHDGAPYIRKTSSMCMNRSQVNGQIRTIGGRLARFPLYEPLKFSRDKKPALPYDEAVAEYGQVKRAFAYKALNRLIQGGAADIMKWAMVEAYEAGLFEPERLGFPLLTVHDELDVSYHDLADVQELAAIMGDVFADKLRVPMRADVEIGATWGEVK